MHATHSHQNYGASPQNPASARQLYNYPGQLPKSPLPAQDTGLSFVLFCRNAHSIIYKLTKHLRNERKVSCISFNCNKLHFISSVMELYLQKISPKNVVFVDMNNNDYLTKQCWFILRLLLKKNSSIFNTFLSIMMWNSFRLVTFRLIQHV